MPKKLIICQHIFLDPFSSPISGSILINEEGIIEEIFKDMNNEKIKKLSLTTRIITYDDSHYIFPGIIDSNIHLNSNFDEEWVDIINSTKMALTGGITTIIDNPILNNKVEDEIKNIENRVNALKNFIYTDCGLLGNLLPENLDNLINIFEKSGCLGFKGYLAPSLQNNLNYLKNDDLIKLKELLKEFSKEVIICLNILQANERDLFICSPCRNTEKNMRLNLEFDIKNYNSYGGAFSGYLNEFDKKNKNNEELSNDSFEEMQDKIDPDYYLKRTPPEKRKSFNTDISPKSAFLTKKVREFALNYEERQLSKLELKDFNFGDNSPEKSSSKKKLKNYLWENDSNIKSSFSSKNSSSDEEKKIENKNGGKKFNPVKRFSYLNEIKSKSLNCLSNNIEEPKKKSIPLLNSIIKNDKRASKLIQRRSKFNSNMVDSRAEITFIEPKSAINYSNNKDKIYQYFLSNHPLVWESNGLHNIMKIFSDFKSNNTNILLHNISSASQGLFIRSEKKLNKASNIFSDTSIPFLYFYSEKIKNGYTKFKCSPPIREKENVDYLLKSLKLETFDILSSFHLQVPYSYKNVDEFNFRRSFSGISTIGNNLQVIWTQLYSMERKRFLINKNSEGLNKNVEEIMKNIIKMLSFNPAKIFHIEKFKGSLKEGKHADFFVWKPFEINNIDNENILLKYPKCYLYKGKSFYGNIKHTFLRGDLVYTHDQNNERIFKQKGKILNNRYL